jgi:hypothetical protein
MDLWTLILDEAYALGFRSIDTERVRLPGVMPEYLEKEVDGVTIVLKERGQGYAPHAIYRTRGRMILAQKSIESVPELVAARSLDQLTTAVNALDEQKYRHVA